MTSAETKTDAVPNRRTIEALFRELQTRVRYSLEEGQACREASEAVDELREKLLNVPEMRQAEARYNMARKKLCKKQKALEEKLGKVRRRYLAEGLTEEVLADVRQLTYEFNG